MITLGLNRVQSLFEATSAEFFKHFLKKYFLIFSEIGFQIDAFRMRLITNQIADSVRFEHQFETH